MLLRSLALVGGLLGSAVASQAPEMMQQYEQRLGGAVEELATVVQDFDADAAGEGMTREAALKRYSESGDELLNRRKTSMESTFVRYERLTGHREALKNATVVERSTLFVKYRDEKLFEGTLEQYKPALPVTIEGGVFGFFGFVFGAMAVYIIGFFLRSMRLMLRKPTKAT